jgi:MFS family permease
VLALATHYFALVVIVPQAAWLAWRAPRRRAVLLAAAPIVAVAAALVPLASDQSSPATTSIPGALGTRIVELPKQLLAGFDAPAELLLTAVAALLVLVGAWLAFDRAEPRARRSAALAGGLGAVAVVGVIAAALVGVDYLNTRNMIEVWLALAAVPAIGFAAPRAGRIGPAAAVALCATFLAAVLAVDANRTYQRDDWRGAAHALGASTVPRAIIVTPGDGVLPLKVYLPRARMLRSGDRVSEIDVLGVALRRKQGEGPEQPTRVPDVSYPQFRLVGARRDRLFLVARYRSPTPVPVSSGILQNSRASDIPALYLYEP